MELSELQLGDVVEAYQVDGYFPGKGIATIVALDEADMRSYPVLLAWNGTEASFRVGDSRHDNLTILTGSKVKHLPNIREKFTSSLWVRLGTIVKKLNGISHEKPCKQCSRKNDNGVNSCWWCGASNPTS